MADEREPPMRLSHRDINYAICEFAPELDYVTALAVYRLIFPETRVEEIEGSTDILIFDEPEEDEG